MGREKYKTTDDTGVDLYWNSFEPVPATPAPACLVLHPGGEKSGAPGPDFVSQDLAQNGFWGLSVEYRLAPPSREMNSSAVVVGFTPGNHESPAQNDKVDHGYYPEGNTDVQSAIRIARADPRCNGLVYCIGGSAGAYYTMYMAATGTVGDDCPDLAVGCSIGISNWFDPNSWQYTNPGDETWPAGAAANWLNITNSCPSVPTGADLVKAQAASVTNKIHSGMPSMFIIISDKDSLGIPTSNGVSIHSWTKGPPSLEGPLEDGTNGMIPTLLLGGYTESVSTVPELGTFKQRTVAVDSHAHAFNYWKTNPHCPRGSREDVIPWLQAGPAEGWGQSSGGGGTIENNLLGYRLWVTGGDGTTGVIGPDDVSATITGLQLDTDYVAHLVAYNQYGDSPEATYAFRSNAASSALRKSQPRGVYALLSVPGGFWGDVTGEHFWNFAHIDGCRARTGWAQIEPIEGQYQWDLLNADIDGLLQFCSDNGKLLGLNVGAGINTPSWLYDVYGVPRMTITSPKTGVMPPPWNPVFLEKYRNFIRAWAAHVDAHASLAYIAEGGLGQVIEFFMASGADYSSWKIRATADGYPTVGDAWIDAANKVTQMHMDYFIKTPIIATLDYPTPNTVPPGEKSGSDTILQWYQPMKNLYGTRLGFMNCGLNPSSNATGNYAPNIIINEQSPFGPAGFQFNHQTPGTDPTTYSGTMTAGLAMKMKFIEVYDPNANTTDATFTATTIATRAAMAAITP